MGVAESVRLRLAPLLGLVEAAGVSGRAVPGLDPENIDGIQAETEGIAQLLGVVEPLGNIDTNDWHIQSPRF